MNEKRMKEFKDLYKKTPGGALIFAAAIVSALQETHKDDKELVEALEDVKELIRIGLKKVHSFSKDLISIFDANTIEKVSGTVLDILRDTGILPKPKGKDKSDGSKV